MAFTRTDMLAAVERSPAAFAVHDRVAWVDAFTPGGRVEDPVGTLPHRGRAAITRFYDTFIGPRDIKFHHDVDIVAGSTVIRDLDLEVKMASGLTMRVPAYLYYDVLEDDGQLKIAELYAFWELPTMVGQFLRSGVRSVPAGLKLSKAMLLNQGFGGTLGFLNGFRGVGREGKLRFGEFLADAQAGNEVAVRRWLTRKATITTGDGRSLTATELLTRLRGTRSHKVIGAGKHLVVGIDRGDTRDVLIADVSVKPFAINRIRYFSDRD